MGRVIAEEKRVWLPYRSTEPEQLARYLEQMAAQGWYPEKIGTYTAKFRQGKPQQLRYCLDFTDVKNDEKELQRYTAQCAGSGWRFRLKSSDGWLLFSAKDPDARPLPADPALAARNFQKFFRKKFLGSLLSVLVWLFWALLDLGIMGSRTVRFLAGWNTMLEFYCVFLLLLILVFLAWNAAESLRGYFAAKKALKNREILPEISEKTIRWRLRRKNSLLWAAEAALGVSLIYDIWAGNFRPAWEQWAAMGIGAAVVIGGFFLKKEWLDGLIRKIAWGAGAVFLILGMALSYPLYRMEPVPFTENDPVIQVEELLPGAELHQNDCEYGHTPLYERWEVRQSGGVPVSENESQGVTVYYTAYRAANEDIARRLYQEELETDLALFPDMERVSLDWPVEEACLLSDFRIYIRDGNCVISMSLMGTTPEELKPLLLEKLDLMRSSE